MESPEPARLRLATFNVHMGVDGWGRPFDVAEQCALLDADVLVVQESWDPDSGVPSTAERVAEHVGLRLVAEVALAHGRLFAPLAPGSPRWGPVLGQVRKTLRLDGERSQTTAGPPDRPFESGQWGVALLARVPVVDVEVVDLGRLRRDPARRAVIRGTVLLQGGPMVVCGTHMSHITHGSHAQYLRLGRQLPGRSAAAVLAGDMNLWGPPTSSYFRGWRRAVVGRSWPAHRPHSQLDHVLVTRPVRVIEGRIGDDAGSDHRPVVVTLGLASTASSVPG